MEPSSHKHSSMTRIKAALAGLDLDTKFLRLRLKAGFDPSQPRVPAGNAAGGRWTDSGTGSAGSPSATGSRAESIRDKTGEASWRSYTNHHRSDGSLAGRTVLNRDGSRITAEFSADGSHGERNTVTLRDGTVFIFENRGETQKIFDGKGRLLSHVVWSPDGPVAQPIVQQVFRDPRVIATEKLIQAGVALYGWWMSGGEPPEGTVFAFKADGYQRDVPGEPPIWTGTLTREEVEEACRKLSTVQSITDQAAKSLNRTSFKNASVYGTAVHKEVKVRVNGGEGEARDPNFRAEVSIVKSKDAAAGREERYGLKDTIRVDVLEKRSDDVVCVYDIKTGKSGLSRARVLEITFTVASIYPGARQILVTEVRPSR